jgi:hypothetical protein
MDKVTEEWRRIHNEQLHDLHSSRNIIRVNKSRIIRWVGRVARTGESSREYRVLVRQTERRHVTIILKLIKKWNAGACTGFIWLRIETGGGRL